LMIAAIIKKNKTKKNLIYGCNKAKLFASCTNEQPPRI
jgi:hypothetical protein